MGRDAKVGHVHRPIPIRQNAPSANRGELFKHTLDGCAISAGYLFLRISGVQEAWGCYCAASIELIADS